MFTIYKGQNFTTYISRLNICWLIFGSNAEFNYWQTMTNKNRHVLWHQHTEHSILIDDRLLTIPWFSCKLLWKTILKLTFHCHLQVHELLYKFIYGQPSWLEWSRCTFALRQGDIFFWVYSNSVILDKKNFRNARHRYV